VVASSIKITLYVQHLLGTGHLVRTQHIAQTLFQAGHDVTLISGGRVRNNQDYKVVQLPVVKTLPGDFQCLLDDEGAAVDDAWKASRANKLLAAVNKSAPDVLIVETWPFGRRQMEFEILPMVESLASLQNSPMIVCSIRDVLQARKPQRRKETLANLEKYFSLVLVHGEQEFIPIEQSFPEFDEIRCPVAYSGYVGHLPNAIGTSDGADEILVSAGGGASGLDLMRVAVDASRTGTRKWRILVGHGVDEMDFQSLQKHQHQALIVERNRMDFQGLLTNCAVSISQFGYNTAMDTLRTRCRAVVVPYSEDGETEQQQRASCFANKDLIVLVDPSDLSVESLHAAVNKALAMRIGDELRLNLDGAATSTKLIEQHYWRFIA